MYKLAGENKNSCSGLVTMLEKYNATNTPIHGAYRACATMMMASHVMNPLAKLSYFRSGKELLEKCISADSSNIEMRLLRFAMQSNVPAFLGYRESLSLDKAYIMENMEKIEDKQVILMIKSYLSKSPILTDSEKRKLNNE